MSTLTAPAGDVRAAAPLARVVLALAVAELRRSLRNPVLYVGTAFSLWFLNDIHPRSEDWAGESYQGMAMASVGLLWGISVATAYSFHRERFPIAVDAPVPGHVRVLARLLAATPLVGLAAAFAGLIAWRQRALGGLALGTEPGRTEDALFSMPELLQTVALGLLAVSVGAALGRRLPHPVGATTLLFVFWWAVGAFYWLYGDRRVTPFSVIQVQPVTIPVGPGDADPLSFPSSWLLEAPTEYEPGWVRAFVSEALAWWHNGWLLGLALLLLAATMPEPRIRRLLVVGGLGLAAISGVAQVQVIP